MTTAPRIDCVASAKTCKGCRQARRVLARAGLGEHRHGVRSASKETAASTPHARHLMARAEWKKLCCPVDFSDPSRYALDVASELAAKFDADLTLFHAHTIPGITFPTGDVLLSQDLLEASWAEVEDKLGDWKKEAERMGAPRVSVSTALGVAYAEINRFARESGQDLIVIGTHGRTALKHALLGSVAERVVREAPCPVLTVRPKPRRT